MPNLQISAQTPVGDIIVAHPFLSRQFENHGIDYCCGGKTPLATACSQKGIPVDQILLELETALHSENELEHSNTLPLRLQPASNAPLQEWTSHIVKTHHAYLWDELPALVGLVQKVAQVHGEEDPRLVELSQRFTPFAQELTLHMRKEEEVLFPMIEALDRALDGHAAQAAISHCGGLQYPIHQMEHEHEDAGEALKKFSELTEGYQIPDWACRSYRAMLDRLKRLEFDLHIHVHKENNLLFPRATKKQADFANLASVKGGPGKLSA
jgi:regulator of cell morphogenesis and NO signaling